MKILFVCAGNTCRSPMAEALAQRLAQEKDRRDLFFASAGTHVWPGDHASADTVAEIKKCGLDVEGRPARQLTEPLMAEADLVLTMTEGISNAVKTLFPAYEAKVSTLPQYVGEQEDVDDPYGCGEEVYHATAQQILRLLEALFQKI